MRVVLFIFSFVCASTLLAQTNWEFDITDQSHSILFPLEVTAATFEQGDFMGVFYEENNELICAGYSEYTGENMVLTAFGTSFSFSGFTDGQQFHFKHWSALTNSEEVFYVTYNSLDFPNTTYFVYNGMSGISSVIETLIDGCTDASAINYNENANVDDNSCVSVLQNQYNLSLDSISNLHTLHTQELDTQSDSTNIVISQFESAIILLDATIASQSEVLLNLETQVNNNNDSLSVLNLLLVALNEDLNLMSDTIASLNEPIEINLTLGWNLIGYTLTFPQDIVTTLASIVDDVIIVKDNSANVYWPDFDFNGIGDLLPGQGYQINVINEQTFIFPAL